MAKSTRPTLLFVYNADSGLFNTLTDIAHKLISPKTYACNLCAITHSPFKMRQEWKEFLETLDADLEFLHRDEFIKQFGLTEIDLPVIFMKKEAKTGAGAEVENSESDNALQVWISADKINRCKDMGELQSLIKQRL